MCSASAGPSETPGPFSESARAALEGIVSVDRFYDENPLRRFSEEIDFGHYWSDRYGLHEANWIVDTGEFYMVAGSSGFLSRSENLEVLVVIPTRAEVDTRPVVTDCRASRGGPVRPRHAHGPRPALRDGIQRYRLGTWCRGECASV